jgi:hypothetical protein
MGRTHPNLVGHWRFENNLLDTSGNGNDGTVGAGSAAYVRGKVGQAWDNDATRFVEIGNPTEMQINTEDGPGLTMCAWAKPSSFPTTGNIRVVFASGTLGSGRHGCGIYYSSVNYVFQVRRGDSVVSAFFPHNNNTDWVHLAGTRRDGVTILYVNGVLVSSNTGEIGDTTPNFPYQIGQREGFSQEIWRFQGQIDDVQIWNRALQPHHIRAIYNGVDPAFIGDIA